ncbi:MAG TPA: putative baseplate assembly protein [Thermoanaerobaculia bacterium]|nr:putative baseplate assembly protein [Thermoanaerobaculia bacterium]
MKYDDLFCAVDTARDDVAANEHVNGIDYVEVVTQPEPENQRVLRVHFIPKSTNPGKASLTAMLDAIAAEPKKVKVIGGTRIAEIEVVSVTRVDDMLRVEVATPGDFSDYRLTIEHVYDPVADADVPNRPPKLHPAYAAATFNFKAGCPSDFDCRDERPCPEPEEKTIPVDYLARDYASFRQALLDLIPTLHPDWIERNPADLGTTLVELLAYTADHLSYYQDAVANEAYLETARQRISVRRHARLIDYHMHDGASARVFVHADALSTGTIPKDTPLLTQITTPIAGKPPLHPVVIASSYVSQDAASRAATAVFETDAEFAVDPILNQMNVYAWRRGNCCLPTGTTRLDLIGDYVGVLKKGDYLLVKERVDPETLQTADASRERRQVVRVTEVRKALDPLDPALALTRVEWDQEDALTFPLCVAAQDADDTWVQVGVTQGNMLLAHHGRRIAEEWFPHEPPAQIPPAEEGEGIQPRDKRCYRFFLDEGPLSFRVPSTDGSVASMRATDPHAVTPHVDISVRTTTGDEVWTWQKDLLSSDDTSTHFVVETDNDGRAMIRFGDGTAGKAPPRGSFIHAEYRVGVGTSGNLGGGGRWHILRPDGAMDFPDIRFLENPMPSWGAVAPESLESVRLTAPAAMRTRTKRAVTPQDYADAAMKHPSVSKAVATFRWTGTWHTVFVTIDPKERTELKPETQERIKSWLTRYLQTGYDLEIDPPSYVPVELEIEVCVKGGHFRAHVERAVREALSSSGGFFHPDRFTFGQPLYLSQVYETVTSVDGVSAATVTKFQRWGDPPAGELQRGAIAVGRTQVIRLDNDPSFPDNGVLRLDMRSGK